MLHRPALATPSFLPPPKNGSLRQAALALVQRLQAVSAKKRPLPDSPSALLLPKTFHRGKGKTMEMEKVKSNPQRRGVLRSPPILENSTSIFPCMKGIPSPAPLVFTPVPLEKLSAKPWIVTVAGKTLKVNRNCIRQLIRTVKIGLNNS